MTKNAIETIQQDKGGVSVLSQITNQNVFIVLDYTIMFFLD